MIEEIKNLIKDDLADLDLLVKKSLTSDIKLIEDVSLYVFDNGGKKIRPILSLLVTKALGAESSVVYLKVAAIVEMIHTASLLHDDVIDESTLRRGKKTANNIWGNRVSILMGDYLFSKSFDLLSSLENPQAFSCMAQATNNLAQGEINQLVELENINLSIEKYIEIVADKTSTLFAVAAELVSIFADRPDLRESLANYGRFIGLSFQIADDLLDYDLNNSFCNELGKNIGDDLNEGKITLPIIFSYRESNPKDKEFLQQAFENKDIAALEKVKQIIINTNAFEKSFKVAEAFVARAKEYLNCLPDSTYKSALCDLADYSLVRKF